MCGRFQLVIQREEIEKQYGQLQTSYEPKIQVFPSQEVLTILRPGIIQSTTWGFQSFPDQKPIINARAETITEKKSFATAFEHSRCLILGDAYYEWHNKQRYKFSLNRLFAFAGIMHELNGKLTTAIITRAASKSHAKIHERMPVVLKREQEQNWLADKKKALQILEKPELEIPYQVDEKGQMTL